MLEVKTLYLVREMKNSKNLRIKVFFLHTYRASKSVKFLSNFKQKNPNGKVGLYPTSYQYVKKVIA